MDIQRSSRLRRVYPARRGPCGTVSRKSIVLDPHYLFPLKNMAGGTYMELIKVEGEDRSGRTRTMIFHSNQVKDPLAESHRP